MSEWIKTWGVLLGLFLGILTFSFESCMTRREINAKLDQARDDRALIRADIKRIENKLEQLNQNYIEHLVHHNKRD